MALATVDEVCPLCNEKIEPGLAIYITKVNLTDNGRSGPGDGGMSYGGSWRETPQGKLRIKYLGSSKPRTCVHQECYEQKIEKILFGKRKKK